MTDPYAVPRFCPHCGEKLLEGARFCGNCGVSIVPPTSQTSTPSPYPPSEPTSPMGWQRPATQQPGVPPYAPPPMMGLRPGVRPAGVTTIGIIQIILGSFLLFSGILLGVFLTQTMFDEIVAEDPESYEGVTYDDFKLVGYVLLIVGPIFIIPAVFMLRREEWARIASMVILGIFGVLLLLSFSLLSLLAIGAGVSIYYLNKPEVKEYFRKQPDFLYRPPDQSYKNY